MKLAALKFLVGATCANGFIFKIMYFSKADCKFADITRVDSGYTESCFFGNTQNTKITIVGAQFAINAYALDDKTCTDDPVADTRRFNYNQCNNRADGTSFWLQQLPSAKLNVVEVYSDAACTTKVDESFLPFNVCKFPLDGKFTSTICQGSDINTYTWETNTCGGANSKAWTFKVGECVQFPGDTTNYYKASRCGNPFDTNIEAAELPYVTPPMMPPEIVSECVEDKCTSNGNDCCAPYSEAATCSDEWVPKRIGECFGDAVGKYHCCPPSTPTDEESKCVEDKCTSEGNDCCAPHSEAATCADGWVPQRIGECFGDAMGRYHCCPPSTLPEEGTECVTDKCTSEGNDCCAPTLFFNQAEKATCSDGWVPKRIGECFGDKNGLYHCCPPDTSAQDASGTPCSIAAPGALAAALMATVAAQV